jgi:hypothetical protein
MVGDGADETDNAPGALDAVISGRTAAPECKACKPPEFRHPVHNLLFLQVPDFTAILISAPAHVLDVPDVVVLLKCERCEPLDLVVIKTRHRYHVDLDWIKSGFLRFFYSLENASYVTTPGDGAVFFRVQSVQADVHTIDAGLFEIICHIGQADAVCGQAQVADSGGLDQGNKAHNVGP